MTKDNIYTFQSIINKHDKKSTFYVKKVAKDSMQLVAIINNKSSLHFQKGTTHLYTYNHKIYVQMKEIGESSLKQSLLEFVNTYDNQKFAQNALNESFIIANNELYMICQKPHLTVAPIYIGTVITDYKVDVDCDFITDGSEYKTFDILQKDEAFNYAIEQTKRRELNPHTVLILRTKQLSADIKVLNKDAWKQIYMLLKNARTVNETMERDFELSDDDLPF